ncbi:hypothetical protein BJX70DRAFT_390630 [Aspergillus crustosus]
MVWVHNLERPDPDDHRPRIIAICVTFAVAACVAVGARFHVRVWSKRSVGLDDFAALFSAVLEVAYVGLTIAQTRWGLGLHADFFPIANKIPFSKMQYVGGPLYTLGVLGFKISLLASYLRIGGFVHSYRVVIMAAIVACVCNQVIFTIVLCLGCQPVAKQWDPSIPGTCINTVASYYALAGTSLAFDVIIIALPMPILAKLQLKVKQKILLGVLFGLGFFVTIIQIIRIFTVKNLKTYTDSEPILIWSIVEISLGVIISCVPTYGPYVRALAIKFPSTRRRPTGLTGKSYGYGQSYGLSPRAANFDGNVFEQGRSQNTTAPMTDVAGSKTMLRDDDSEETMLDDRDSESRMQSRGKEMDIHIATEVKVERRPRDSL